MKTARSPRMLAMVAVSIASALTFMQCSSSPEPSSPTVASVSLNPASIAAGATSQGTVNLTSAIGASGGSVALTSSNTAVATVPATVPVAGGGTSATFTVTGVSAGTATITAAFNTTQSATITVR